MKRCPNCDRTFDDSMRFCQTDGTPLVADEPIDPYKTMVARPSDIAAATPPPPAQDRPIPPPKDDDSVLEIPADNDPNNTMFASEDEIRREMDSHDAKNEQVIDIPPLVEAPAPPKFNEPEIAPPSFGSAPPSPYSTPGAASSPFAQTTPPIPSPFSEPQRNPFNEPQSPPSFSDPEPVSQSGPPSNPFDSPKGGPMEPAAWTPPPAPDSSWENQQIGQNTPFQPPMAGTGNANQTMAVVSLVLGIISVVFCQITGPVAMVLGFLARRKATERPNEYGGAGLALAGMITGAIGTVFLVLLVLYLIFVVGLVATQSF